MCPQKSTHCSKALEIYGIAGSSQDVLYTENLKNVWLVNDNNSLRGRISKQRVPKHSCWENIVKGSFEGSLVTKIR